jgi:hypothetical protein
MLFATLSSHVERQENPPRFLGGIIAALRILFLTGSKSSRIGANTFPIRWRLSFIAASFCT